MAATCSGLGDNPRFIAADMAFHALIAEMSGNSIVAAVAKGMLHWLQRFKRDLVSVRGAERVTIEEHEKILRAIANGDAEGAARAMAEHITRANDLYRQLARAAPAGRPRLGAANADADAQEESPQAAEQT